MFCHNVSPQNCLITPPRTGPLQITGSVSFASIRLTETMSIPQVVVAGRISPSALPTRFMERPNAFGIDGPVISPSKIAVLNPSLIEAAARSEVTIDLPTPPLPDTTPITFLTELPLLNFTRKSSGLDSLCAQLSPQLLQSCVQSLIIFTSRLTKFFIKFLLKFYQFL